MRTGVDHVCAIADPGVVPGGELFLPCVGRSKERTSLLISLLIKPGIAGGLWGQDSSTCVRSLTAPSFRFPESGVQTTNIASFPPGRRRTPAVSPRSEKRPLRTADLRAERLSLELQRGPARSVPDRCPSSSGAALLFDLTRSLCVPWITQGAREGPGRRVPTSET